MIIRFMADIWNKKGEINIVAACIMNDISVIASSAYVSIHIFIKRGFNLVSCIITPINNVVMMSLQEIRTCSPFILVK